MSLIWARAVLPSVAGGPGRDLIALRLLSTVPPPLPIKQIPPAVLLRVVGVLDLEPFGARVVWVAEALGDDAFEVVRAHQFEELATSALDSKRLGNDRR